VAKLTGGKCPPGSSDVGPLFRNGPPLIHLPLFPKQFGLKIAQKTVIYFNVLKEVS